MRYALIENDIVINVVEADSPDVLLGKTLVECLAHTIAGDRLNADGSVPREIMAWSKEAMERRRFTESEPPGDDYTTQEPPLYCVGWDDAAGKWVVDEATRLHDAKTAKKASIDANTNRIKDRDGLSYAGQRFSMTETAKVNWTGLLAAKDILTYPYYILTIDDKPFALGDATALLMFVAAVMGYETDPASPLASGRTLRQRVEAAATVEEVDAVVDDRE